MLATKLVLSFCLAFAEECVKPDNEEVELLQKKVQDKIVEKQLPDFGKIVDAAKGAVNQGITGVTTKMDKVFDTVNYEVTTAESKLNASFADFDSKANANFTLSENVTNFKKLVGRTVGEVVPSLNAAMQKVVFAVAQTQNIVATLGTLGPKDLAEKLDSCSSTVKDKLKALTETTEAIGQDMAGATSEKFADHLATMKLKLDDATSTASSLKEDFNDKLEAFLDVLEGPLKATLGDDAAQQLDDLSSKADEAMANLEHLVAQASTQLKSSGDLVDSKLNAPSEGFFKKIWHGLFR